MNPHPPLTLQDLDAKVTLAFNTLMKKYSVDPLDKSLKYKHLAKIQEEMGELAEQILKSDNLQRKEKGGFRMSDLEEELSDTIFALFYLAKTLDINLEELMVKRLGKDTGSNLG